MGAITSILLLLNALCYCECVYVCNLNVYGCVSEAYGA